MITKDKLAKCPVIFDQEKHTYSYDGMKLSGVTTMLGATLFKDKYAGVDPAILAKAAKRGTEVHEGVELLISLGINDGSAEVMNFLSLLSDNDCKAIESEYLISDLTGIASSIDLVLTDKKGKIVLGDIKTTYGGLDKTYLSWQLSVYAYLFELQNPKLKVDSLVGVWLRGNECEWAEIPRQPSENVARLITDYESGYPCTIKAYSLPENVGKLASMIAAKVMEKKRAELEEAEMKERLLQIMKDNGCEKVDLETVLITYVAPTTRDIFDGKKFQADHPELYAGYLKESKVKESLKITVR